MSAVALMDARSIAATAANGGKLTAATDLDIEYDLTSQLYPGKRNRWKIKQKLPFRRNPSGSFFMLLLFNQTHHHADFFNPGYFFF